jgi:hypothetical protein
MKSRAPIAQNRTVRRMNVHPRRLGERDAVFLFAPDLEEGADRRRLDPFVVDVVLRGGVI